MQTVGLTIVQCMAAVTTLWHPKLDASVLESAQNIHTSTQQSGSANYPVQLQSLSGWTADDIPAAACTPHTDFSAVCTPLQLEFQPCTHPLQPPNPTPTLASAPASLTVCSSSWPIRTSTSKQTDPRRLQTELTKLQTPGHPSGSAKWNFTPRRSEAD